MPSSGFMYVFFYSYRFLGWQCIGSVKVQAKRANEMPGVIRYYPILSHIFGMSKDLITPSNHGLSTDSSMLINNGIPSAANARLAKNCVHATPCLSVTQPTNGTSGLMVEHKNKQYIGEVISNGEKTWVYQVYLWLYYLKNRSLANSLASCFPC